MTDKPIKLQVQHSRTKERRTVELVEIVAQHQRRRAVAKALRVRWPNGAGIEVFDIASGYDLAEQWCLTFPALMRARLVAQVQGCTLPDLRKRPPRKPANDTTAPPAPSDPRQLTLFRSR